MAAPKQILVTYLERKKIITIPDGSGGDVDFLAKEVSQVFGIESSDIVTFQRFNPTFEE